MYSSIASIFDDIYPHSDFKARLTHLSEMLEQDLRDARNVSGSVVDLCCGTGRGISIWNDSSNIRLVGVDIDNSLLAQAKRNYPNAEFYNDDIRKIDFAAINLGNVDVVTMFGVSIMHFDSNDRKRIFAKVRSLLSGTGTFSLDILPPDRLNIHEHSISIKADITKDKARHIVIYDEKRDDGRYEHTHLNIEIGEEYSNVRSDSFFFYYLDSNCLTNELISAGFSQIEIVPTNYSNSIFCRAQ